MGPFTLFLVERGLFHIFRGLWPFGGLKISLLTPPAPLASCSCRDIIGCHDPVVATIMSIMNPLDSATNMVFKIVYFAATILGNTISFSFISTNLCLVTSLAVMICCWSILIWTLRLIWLSRPFWNHKFLDVTTTLSPRVFLLAQPLLASQQSLLSLPFLALRSLLL